MITRIGSAVSPSKPAEVIPTKVTPKVTESGRTQEAALTPQSKPTSDENDRALPLAIEELNETIEFVERGLEFAVHEETDRVVVRVIDKETEEVIREIPPEKMLDLVAQLRELIGFLVDEKA